MASSQKSLKNPSFSKKAEPEQVKGKSGQATAALASASWAGPLAKLDRQNTEVVRVDAAKELANIASHKINRKQMWQSEATRLALMDAADRHETASVRVHALRAMSNLAVDEANQLPMWNSCRSVLLTAVAIDEAAEFRRQGLWALVNMSLDAPEVQRAMWNDTEGEGGGARGLMVSGATGAHATDDRVLCLWILTNLACVHDNKQPMWLDEHTRGVVLESASNEQPEAVRVQALRVLAMQAHDASTHCMWHDDGVARPLLLETSAAAQKCRPVRMEALRALQLMGLSRKDVDELGRAPQKGNSKVAAAAAKVAAAITTSKAATVAPAEPVEPTATEDPPAAVAPAPADSLDAPAAVAPPAAAPAPADSPVAAPAPADSPAAASAPADSLDAPSADTPSAAEADRDGNSDVADSGGSAQGADAEVSGVEAAEGEAQ